MADRHASDCTFTHDDRCTSCGGEGLQEPDDPLYEGTDWIDCKACFGTGLACRQVVW